MNGIETLISGFDFQNSHAYFDLPVPRGCRGFYLFGDMLGKNLVDGGVQPVTVGSPVRATAYSTRFTANDFIDTMLAETPDASYFAIGKMYANPDGLEWRSEWVGNYAATIGNVNLPGSGLVFEAKTAQAQMVGGSFSGVPGTSSNPNVAVLPKEAGLPTNIETGVWRVMYGSVSATGDKKRIIRDMTRNVTAEKDIVAGNVRDMRNTTTLRIGRGGDDSNAKMDTELMMVVVFDTVLTSDEQQQQLNYGLLWASKFGLALK